MRRGRTLAEWVTLGVSSLVLLLVVGAVVHQMTRPDRPPAPVAKITEVRPVAGQFQVTVDVVNHGDQTAENVQVSGELDLGGQVTSGDQTITFLAGGESVSVVFVFPDDPRDGDLSIAVTGFTVP